MVNVKARRDYGNLGAYKRRLDNLSAEGASRSFYQFDILFRNQGLKEDILRHDLLLNYVSAEIVYQIDDDVVTVYSALIGHGNQSHAKAPPSSPSAASIAIFSEIMPSIACGDRVFSLETYQKR